MMRNYDLFTTLTGYLRYMDIATIFCRLDNLDYFATIYLIDNPITYLKIKYQNKCGLYLPYLGAIILFDKNNYNMMRKYRGCLVLDGYQYGYNIYPSNYNNIMRFNFNNFTQDYIRDNHIKQFMADKLYIIGYKRGVKHGRELIIDPGSRKLLYYSIHHNDNNIAAISKCGTPDSLYIEHNNTIHIYKGPALVRKYDAYHRSVHYIMTRYGNELCDIYDDMNKILVNIRDRYLLLSRSNTNNITQYKFNNIIRILDIMQ